MLGLPTYHQLNLKRRGSCEVRDGNGGYPRSNTGLSPSRAHPNLYDRYSRSPYFRPPAHLPPLAPAVHRISNGDEYSEFPFHHFQYFPNDADVEETKPFVESIIMSSPDGRASATPAPHSEDIDEAKATAPPPPKERRFKLSRYESSIPLYTALGRCVC